MLNGIVVVNKPRGVTSSDCVYKLRKILQIRKIGHAGTLDPEVNGVLPIAIGQATKLIAEIGGPCIREYLNNKAGRNAASCLHFVGRKNNTGNSRRSMLL